VIERGTSRFPRINTNSKGVQQRRVNASATRDQTGKVKDYGISTHSLEMKGRREIISSRKRKLLQEELYQE